MQATLLYNRKQLYPWYYITQGDDFFNARPNTRADGEYFVIGSGEESELRNLAGIIDIFRNGKQWDSRRVIQKFNQLRKLIKDAE